MSRTHTIVNKLGRITGVVHNNVVQYRGLPYARIPDRFKDPIGPLDFLGDFDGTQWGPMAIQPTEGERIDSSVLNTVLDPMPDHRKQMSEIDCANLVIVTPFDDAHRDREQGRLSPMDRLLPTIVWVHGGAGKIGSANYTGYDMRNFVSHSIEVAGRPVVAVSLNFRLGTLGYLMSEEVGATGNYALKDQVMGLEWVHHHIEEFGGDPNNITYFGESAGAISGSLHLYSPTPLFQRAIFLSGLAGFYPPCPPAHQEEIYKDTLAKLGIDQYPASERVGRFLRVNASELGRIAFEVDGRPTSDGQIIPTDKWLRHEGFKPLPDWCESVLVGSCKDEWCVLKMFGSIDKYAHPVRMLRYRLSTYFTPSEITELFSAFSITEADETGPNRAATIEKIYTLIADYAIRFPTYYFSRHWTAHGKKAFLASTSVGNPLPGQYQGRANHGVDIVFSFLNFNAEMPQEGGYVELARGMATTWCRYASGEEPWTPLGSEGVVKVFDVGAREKECELGELDRRQWERWEVMERLGLDKGWEVTQAFLGVLKEGDPE